MKLLIYLIWSVVLFLIALYVVEVFFCPFCRFQL